MEKYRKRPVEIEAVQVGPHNVQDVVRWIGENGTEDVEENTGGALAIFTLEGAMRANAGDWVIRGVQGEFYPCKPDIFEATYEAVS